MLRKLSIAIALSAVTAGVANAETAGIGGLAVALDQHDGAGNLVAGDFVLDVGVDAGKPGGAKTGLTGLGDDGTFGKCAGDSEDGDGNE